MFEFLTKVRIDDVADLNMALAIICPYVDRQTVPTTALTTASEHQAN